MGEKLPNAVKYKWMRTKAGPAHLIAKDVESFNSQRNV